MNCPLEIPENAQVLLDYGARKLDAPRTAILERHMEICPACREFAAGQRAVWEALDSWEAAPVSREFDRKLYQRIEKEVSWWDLLVRPFRPLMVRRGLPVAAAACLLVVAGVLIERPAGSPVPKNDMAQNGMAQSGMTQNGMTQMEPVQPEQVERTLDAMEMLNEFSHRVRNDGQESKL